MTDRPAIVRSALPEIDLIRDDGLREAVVAIWVDTWERSAWQRLEDCPKHESDLPDRPLLDHVRSVTQQALAVADVMATLHGVAYDHDTLVAGGLLHDVSKLVESEPGDGALVKSRKGTLLQHGLYGAHMALAFGLSDEITHIVVSHTHQSRVVPSTVEAIIIHYVDFCDSDALLHLAGKPLFAKRS